MLAGVKSQLHILNSNLDFGLSNCKAYMGRILDVLTKVSQRPEWNVPLVGRLIYFLKKITQENSLYVNRKFKIINEVVDQEFKIYFE